MAKRDMSEAAFFDAIKRHGIQHDGAKWCAGTYWMEGYGIPVFGFGRQLDTSSRRALLAELLQRQSGYRRQKKERDDVRGLQRGDRVEHVSTSGAITHAVVLVPMTDAKLLKAIDVDGRRMSMQLAHCRKPGSPWRGPSSLIAALEADRARLQRYLADVEAEIHEAKIHAAVEQVGRAS